MIRPLFMLLALAACGPGTIEPPSETDGSITLGLEVGGTFVELDDGADVEMVSGAQGGFHVDVVARVKGMPERIDVVREVRRADTRQLITKTEFRSNVSAAGRLSFEAPVFLCPAPIGINVAGETLDVTYIVGEARATLTFLPVCPAGDTFCDQICRR